MSEDYEPFTWYDYPTKRNRRIRRIRRTIVACMIALALTVFIVWGWSLPEV